MRSLTSLEPDRTKLPVRVAEWQIAPGTSYAFWPVIWRGWRQKPWWAWLGPLSLVPAFTSVLRWPASGPIALVAYAICAGIWRARREPEVPKVVQWPMPEGHFPVAMTMKCEGQIVGSDEGVVAFVGGWLVYMGRECSFSFRAVDCESKCRHLGFGASTALEREVPSRELWCDLDGVRVQFEPHDVVTIDGKRISGLALDFHRTAKKWVEEMAAPIGSPVLPPASPHPIFDGYYRTHAKSLYALSLISAGTALWLVLSKSDKVASWLFFLLAGGLFIAGCHLLDRRRAAANRKRRTFGNARSPSCFAPALSADNEQHER